jgi:hypothetical protein
VAISDLNLGAYGSPDGPAIDRLPPQDVQAEQSVLGGMLISKDAIAEAAERLKSNDFYRPAHETLYEAMVDLFSRGEPVDAITVADELTKRGTLQRVGGHAYLHDLIQSVPTAANVGYYAAIVAERSILRRLVAAGTRIVQLGYGEGEGEVDEIVNRAQAEVYAVGDKRGSEDYIPLAQTLEETLTEIEVAGGRSDEFIGVPTGFTELDELAARAAQGPDDRPRRPPRRRQVDLRHGHRALRRDQAPDADGDLLARNEPHRDLHARDRGGGLDPAAGAAQGHPRRHGLGRRSPRSSAASPTPRSTSTTPPICR